MNPLSALYGAVEQRRRLVAWKRKGQKIYICHVAHENDRVAIGHLSAFFDWVGINVRGIEFNLTGQRPELGPALGEDSIAVIGYNNQLDHSWIGDEKFIAMAERRGIPVIQYILDHPSLRWPEFHHNLDAPNVRYLFPSHYCEDYFRRYGPRRARTACFSCPINPLSRVEDMSLAAFLGRDVACLIPLNLRRLGGTADELQNRIRDLDPPVAESVGEAIDRARFDLDNPLLHHLETALARRGIEIPNESMHVCAAIVEDVTHVWRRRRIFEVASRFPALIQTDLPPPELLVTGIATFRTTPEWTNPKATIERMKTSRAVVSVSLTNDAPHDRMGNAINAGCVAVLEANAIHRRLFKAGQNALLFRYDDDSLERCLDLVCNDPEGAYEVARRGAQLRNSPSFRFRGGNELLKLVYD